MQYIGGANLENVILSPFEVCILPSSAVMETLKLQENARCSAAIEIDSGALLAHSIERNKRFLKKIYRFS